jgi:SAM-dependent methyltransferase
VASFIGRRRTGSDVVTTSTQWQLARDAAERYERILVPAILGPAARALVEHVAPGEGEALIDLGCGTGAATRLAAERVGASGRVVGIDVNAGMLAVAASLPPVAGVPIEWVERSVHELPFSEPGFDLALCAQTLQFLGDRPRALVEARRVLKPGGRFAASLWSDLRQSPYFHVLVESMAEHVGAEAASGLRAAFGLSDSEEIRVLLSGAGFRGIELTTRHLELELPDLEEFVPRHVSATPMAPGYDAASEAARRAVVEQVVGRLDGYRTGAGYRIPFSLQFATAAA